MYDKINLKMHELSEQKKNIGFKYFKDNIDMQHFYSYLYYKIFICLEKTYFDDEYQFLELEKLYLRNCKIDKLNKNFLDLTKNIKELYLSHNNLTNINFIEAFTSLQFKISIDVSHNNILYLPTEIKNIALIDINLKDNKLLLLKKNQTEIGKIIKQNPDYTTYTEELNTALREGKILFVSSSLTKSLQNLLLPYLDDQEHFKERFKIPPPTPPTLPTSTSNKKPTVPWYVSWLPQNTNTNLGFTFGFGNGQSGGKTNKYIAKTRKNIKKKKFKLSKKCKQHKY